MSDLTDLLERLAPVPSAPPTADGPWRAGRVVTIEAGGATGEGTGVGAAGDGAGKADGDVAGGGPGNALSHTYVSIDSR